MPPDRGVEWCEYILNEMVSLVLVAFDVTRMKIINILVQCPTRAGCELHPPNSRWPTLAVIITRVQDALGCSRF